MYAYQQVVYYNCVKFHQYRFILLRGVVLIQYIDRLADRWTDRVIPIYPQSNPLRASETHKEM